MPHFDRLRTFLASTPLRGIYQGWRGYRGYLRNDLYRGMLRAGQLEPSSRAVKERVIREYAQRFGLQILIETGTYRGDTVEAMREVFEQIYSFEVAGHLYQAALQRFRAYHHIRLLHGDSGILLGDVLAGIRQPCLFWLDAHYSRYDTGRGRWNTAIRQELLHISTHPLAQQHVILIDDARCFTGVDDYPTLPFIRELGATAGLDVFQVSNDIISLRSSQRSAPSARAAPDLNAERPPLASQSNERASVRLLPRRVLIVGAGVAGSLVLEELRQNPRLGLIPVGFVDDDRAKRGTALAGLQVLGTTDQLAELRDRYAVDEVIIAMPSASGSAVRAALQKAQTAALTARTVPTLQEILTGRVRVSALRPVQIEDLLRREPVHTDLTGVQHLISGQTVLVTGAGGSIGSELCRQVAALQPVALGLLGHGENSVFAIASELADHFPGLRLLPLIADIRDSGRITRIVAGLAPQIIFHAAAHKHVPLMEQNACEAVTNNVLGTRNLAEAAVACGASRFVLVSSDKAVQPASIMGASKRIAEMIVLDLAQRYQCNMMSVRFGNVLGSRGSVVPIFLRQIEAGGPVKVTHPEMRRFFMTIPESAQLILQTAALGRGGEVFALDMGEPVRIADLAADLIYLSGLDMGADIEIQFTGIRPGEKLKEELFFAREQAEQTEHPKVLRALSAPLPPGISLLVSELIELAQSGASAAELQRHMKRIVPDYVPAQPNADPTPAGRSQPVDSAGLVRTAVL